MQIVFKASLQLLLILISHHLSISRRSKNSTRFTSHFSSNPIIQITIPSSASRFLLHPWLQSRVLRFMQVYSPCIMNLCPWIFCSWISVRGYSVYKKPLLLNWRWAPSRLAHIQVIYLQRISLVTCATRYISQSSRLSESLSVNRWNAHSQSFWLSEITLSQSLNRSQSIISIKRVTHSQSFKVLQKSHLYLFFLSKLNVAKPLLFVPHPGHSFLIRYLKRQA